MEKTKVALVTVYSSSQDVDGIQKVITSRYEIAQNYCKQKGWSTNPTDLSFEQILEIRKLKEWIDAGK